MQFVQWQIGEESSVNPATISLALDDNDLEPMPSTIISNHRIHAGGGQFLDLAHS